MRVVDLDIDFMKRRYVALMLSAVLFLSAGSSLIFKGLNFGLDFTGGTLVEVEFLDGVQPETVRQLLEKMAMIMV